MWCEKQPRFLFVVELIKNVSVRPYFCKIHHGAIRDHLVRKQHFPKNSHLVRKQHFPKNSHFLPPYMHTSYASVSGDKNVSFPENISYVNIALSRSSA